MDAISGSNSSLTNSSFLKSSAEPSTTTASEDAVATEAAANDDATLSTSGDTIVIISEDALARAQQDAAGHSADGSGDSTDEPKDYSALQSFGYGALGMPYPYPGQQSSDGYYTTGLTINALGRIGTVVAVLS